MAHELEVWLFADRVGTLVLVDGRLNFVYAPDWLSRPNAIALSASLPLQAEPFDDRKTRPFFAGLLPEGQMRRLIAQQFQVSGQNDFALLDHIGGECAGAVTFLEPGQTLPVPTRNNDVQWLSDEEVVAILDELPRRPMLDGSAIARAIDYSLSRWAALTRYIDTGDLPADNNRVENLIRPIALGRSNWLFAGSLRAGKRAANIMSLLHTARINGHEPHAYLKDVLERLPTQPANRIEELLPYNWQPPKLAD
jgi:HipA-like protein